MDNIYYYNDEFDKSFIIQELKKISSKIEECHNNPNEKNNSKYARELIYEQFIKGLKLSIR